MYVMVAERCGRLGHCSCADGRRVHVWLKCPNAGWRFSAVMTSQKAYLLTYHLQCWRDGPLTSACATATRHSLLFDLCANQINFSPIDLDCTVFELAKIVGALLTRWRFSVTCGTLSPSLSTSCLSSCF